MTELGKISESEYSKFSPIKISEMEFQIRTELLLSFQGLNDYKNLVFSLEQLQKLRPEISVESNLKFLYLITGLNEISTKEEKNTAINEGIKLSRQLNNDFFLEIFYLRKLFFYLQEKKISEAEKYLVILNEIYQKKKQESFDLIVAKGFIEGWYKRQDISEKYFLQAEDMWNKSGNDWGQGTVLLVYQAEVAHINNDFLKWNQLSEKTLQLCKKNKQQ